MSFSIGPMMGRRDAVLKRVAETGVNANNSQLAEVKTYITSALSQLHSDNIVSVHAFGHHAPSGPGMIPNHLVAISINYGPLALNQQAQWVE